MKRFLSCGGMLLLAAAGTGEIIFSDTIELHRERMFDWAFVGALGSPLTARDWVLVVAVLVVVALNMFLWTLPISQHALFFISFPSGIAALLAFMWFGPRK